MIWIGTSGWIYPRAEGVAPWNHCGEESLFCAKYWEGYIEGGTLSLNRFKPDSAIMTFDQFAAQVEPKTRTTNIVRISVVSSHKTAEYAPLLVNRNAYPVITHTQQCRVIAVICIHIDLYIAAIRAIFDRVANKVAHYLFYASVVD